MVDNGKRSLVNVRRWNKVIDVLAKRKGRFPSEIWNLDHFARLKIIGFHVRNAL